MADIRINQLPPEASPVASENVAIDGASTRRTTIQALVDAGAPVASQAEAEDGTNAVKRMTPLTTAQAIEAQVSPAGISGNYGDLSGRPILGTAAAEDATAFATAASGLLANTAMQPTIYDPSSVAGDVYDDILQKRATAANVAARTVPAYVGLVRTSGAVSAGDGQDFNYRRYVPRNVLPNGGFANSSGWVLGTGWTVSSSRANYSGGLNNYIGHDISLPAGTYRATYSINVTSGGGRVRFYTAGGASMISQGTFRSVTGSYTEDIVVASDAARVGFASGSSGSAFYIDDFQILPLTPLAAGKIQSTDGAWWEDQFSSDFIVRIPEDFATFQDAIDFYARIPVANNARIILRLSAGQTISTGLTLTNVDASKFVLSAVDAEVPLSSGFTGTVIRGIDSIMPTLNFLINAAAPSTGEGIWLTGACLMKINPGCGIKNAWGTGLLARGGAVVYAQQSIFTGCARNNTTGAGITAWGAYIDATSANVSDSDYYGAQAAHGGCLTFELGLANDCFRYGIRASDAACIDFSEGQASRCGVYGIYAFQNSHINAPTAVATDCGSANAGALNGSTVNVRQADLRNSDGSAILAYASLVDAYQAQLDGAALYGVNAECSIVSAAASTATGCSRGYYATRGATISAGLANANSCTDTGFYAERSSSIDAKGATATGCTVFGILAIEGSSISANGATLTGAGTGGARSIGGSRIDVGSANCRKGVSDNTGTTTADIQCFTGSTINAAGSTGGLNRTANTVTAEGIIFK